MFAISVTIHLWQQDKTKDVDPDGWMEIQNPYITDMIIDADRVEFRSLSWALHKKNAVEQILPLQYSVF